MVIAAAFSRYMRSAAVDALAQDYMKVVRAKGLPERLVLSRHLLRNACLPMITLIGLSIPALLAGNLILETVFNYPGLGLLFFNSLGNADYEVLLALTLIGAFLVVVGNFVAPAQAKPRQEPLADLVTIGSLDLVKNHRFLLAVLAEAKRAGRSFSLDVFGEGPLADEGGEPKDPKEPRQRLARLRQRALPPQVDPGLYEM